MVAAVICFSSASLYWACHARVATEQDVIERIAVECQAGAFEDKLGEGEETSGGSHDDLGEVEEEERPWERKFLPSPGVAQQSSVLRCKASLGRKCGIVYHVEITRIGLPALQ